MKKRLFLPWILPAFAIMFAPAQQSSELLKTTSLTPSALPAPHGMTAFNPYWSLGRGFWKGGNLIFLEPRQPRVDLYDKDSIRSSIKVKFPGNADVRLHARIARLETWPDGRLSEGRWPAEAVNASQTQRDVRSGAPHKWCLLEHPLLVTKRSNAALTNV